MLKNVTLYEMKACNFFFMMRMRKTRSWQRRFCKIDDIRKDGEKCGTKVQEKYMQLVFLHAEIHDPGRVVQAQHNILYEIKFYGKIKNNKNKTIFC